MSENENVEQAAEVLGGSDGSDPVPKGDKKTAEGDSGKDVSGVNRLFRTDRSLDMDQSYDFWSPDDGGINRIGAAIQQAGGFEAMPPIVWMLIGAAEAIWAKVRTLDPFQEGSDDA